jgi:hypothetical protein
VSIVKTLWGVAVDLVVGDDPKIALAVLVALAFAAGLLLSGLNATCVTVGGAVLVAAAFTLSLLIDVRSSLGHRGD